MSDLVEEAGMFSFLSVQKRVQMLLPAMPLKNLFKESLYHRSYSPVHTRHYLNQAPIILLCSCGAIVPYHTQSQPAAMFSVCPQWPITMPRLGLKVECTVARAESAGGSKWVRWTYSMRNKRSTPSGGKKTCHNCSVTGVQLLSLCWVVHGRW